MTPWQRPLRPTMDKALGYLGLAAKAGQLAVGAEDCAKVLRGRKGRLLVTASDAGSAAQRRAAILARDQCLVLSTDYTKQDIARAVGRTAPVAMTVIMDEGLAKAFAAAVQLDRGKQEERV